MYSLERSTIFENVDRCGAVKIHKEWDLNQQKLLPVLKLNI